MKMILITTEKAIEDRRKSQVENRKWHPPMH